MRVSRSLGRLCTLYLDQAPWLWRKIEVRRESGAGRASDSLSPTSCVADATSGDIAGLAIDGNLLTPRPQKLTQKTRKMSILAASRDRGAELSCPLNSQVAAGSTDG